MEIFITRITYFYQNLILLTIYNGDKLNYLKSFIDISVGGIKQFPEYIGLRCNHSKDDPG